MWNLKRKDTKELVQTYGNGERGREGEIYGESHETYITICKIDSQWAFAVWLRKLKQGAQETQTGALYQPRGLGWEGRWEGSSKGG